MINTKIKYPSNQVKDKLWLEMSRKLDYNECVAGVCLQRLDVGTERGLQRQLAIGSNVGFRKNLLGLIYEK